MKDPKELIEECKRHLKDNKTHQQQYQTDIRKLITALERALSIAHVVGQSEQFYCDCELPTSEFELNTGEILCCKCEKPKAN